MKSISALIALCALAASAAFAAPPPGHPSPAAAADMMKMAPVSDAELTEKGKILNTIVANEYVYIEVEQGKNTLWLAAPQSPLKKGDMIRFDDGVAMNNFHSKLLNRTFPSVKFVNRVQVVK